jgi:hypothetical protein
MTLWVVKFPAFPIIRSISGIVNVTSVVVPVSVCVLILGSLEAIIISVISTKSRLRSVK